MPYKSNPFLLAVLGILGLGLVLALVLIGRDPRRSARSGPMWKRRLLTVALALLASGGLVATSTNCVTCYEPMPPGAGLEREDFLAKAEHLAVQLPLLEKFVVQERIDENVVRKVLATVEQDVYLLESEFAKRQLQSGEFARAQDLCRTARVSLKALRLRVGDDEHAQRYFEWNRELERKHREAGTQPAAPATTPANALADTPPSSEVSHVEPE